MSKVNMTISKQILYGNVVLPRCILCDLCQRHLSACDASGKTAAFDVCMVGCFKFSWSCDI